MSTGKAEASGSSGLPLTANEPTPTGNRSGERPSGKGARSGPEETRLQGHWLLAKMGKRVLSPGGMELTRRILAFAAPRGEDRIVELGPGVGKTAELLLAAHPARYWGVDVREDPDNPLLKVLAGHRNAILVSADAKETGLEDGCATLVVGEAMLTMQSDEGKLAIMREACRLLEPGGRYAVHEMGFTPDASPEVTREVERALSRTIKVGARPLSAQAWKALLEEAGFDVKCSTTNKMALLDARRVIADEGLAGFLGFVFNVARNPAARSRVRAMRKVFKANQHHVCSVGFVAVKPA